MGIAALVNLISGHYTYLNDAVQGITLIFYFYIFFKCLWLYYKGFSTAKFVVFGFSFYLFGVVLYLCQNLGFIPTNFVTNNAIVLGTAAEVLLFSLALGDRINIIRKEKEVSQAALLQQTQENEKIIKEQNALLEEKVNEKTLDLQTANEELQQTHEEILAQRDMVVQKNEELENYRHKISKSIESALLIQNAILPTKEKLSVLLKEFFIIYRPRDVVSGDFYWTNQIGEYKFAVVADCTGHGVSGAFMTMIGSGLLDRIIGVMKIHEPNLILETLHTQIQTLLQQEQTGNTDGMDILVTKWHEKNGEIHLEFSAAKRPLYYISSDDRSFHKIQGSRKMVGGMNKKEKYFEKNNIILKKNTLLYLTTDGYTHQNNAENKSISEKKLTEMLENLQDNSMSEQKSYLENFLNQHMKGCEQRDDILLVGIRL